MALLLVDVTPGHGTHPCLRCGACCAFYRTSFYWAEADDTSPGGVPVELTEVISPHLRAMRGTNQPRPRCTALEGDIGSAVHCSIHPRRPSACRDYLPSYEDGTPNPRCDAARAAWGLPALTPGDWAISVPATVEVVDLPSVAQAAALLDGTGTPAALMPGPDCG